MRHPLRAAAVVLTAAISTGCAIQAPRQGQALPSVATPTTSGVAPAQARVGIVESVQELRRDAQGNWMPGAFTGGAVTSGNVSPGRVGDSRAFEVTVVLDDANRVTLRQRDVSDLQPGMRVLVDDGVARRF